MSWKEARAEFGNQVPKCANYSQDHGPGHICPSPCFVDFKADFLGPALGLQPGEVREKMEDLPSLEAQLEALRVELRELDEKRREEELRLKAFEKEI